MLSPRSGVHPFEITDVFKRPPEIIQTRRAPTNTRLRFSRVRASFAVGENAPNGCDQTIKFDRLGVELLAPRGYRLLTLASQRMCGQGDDWNVLGLRVAFQAPCGFPAVNDGHLDGKR